MLCSASRVTMVITDNGIKEPSKLSVIIRGHRVTSEAGVLVVDAGADALVEG